MPENKMDNEIKTPQNGKIVELFIAIFQGILFLEAMEKRKIYEITSYHL